MTNSKTIHVKGTEVVIFSKGNEEFISITDIGAPLKTKKFEADEPEKAQLTIVNEHFEGEVQRRNSKFLEVPIARYKNYREPKDVVKNWMRSRTTIEFLGLWEKIHNPDFKGVEFDSFLYLETNR